MGKVRVVGQGIKEAHLLKYSSAPLSLAHSEHIHRPPVLSTLQLILYSQSEQVISLPQMKHLNKNTTGLPVAVSKIFATSCRSVKAET
jgi:hypothetical protein